jgi:hypothetical protein
MHCQQEMTIQQLLLDQWTRTETASLGEGAGALILKNMNMLSLVEQLFTAKFGGVCLLMLTILQHHIQMVWVQKCNAQLS